MGLKDVISGRWKLILAAAAAIAILAALVIAVYGTPSYWSEKAGKMAECEGKAKEDAKRVCYLNLAYRLKDTGVCDRLDTEYLRQVCIGRVGVATKDPGLCDRIANKTVREECRLYALM